MHFKKYITLFYYYNIYHSSSFSFSSSTPAELAGIAGRVRQRANKRTRAWIDTDNTNIDDFSLPLLSQIFFFFSSFLFFLFWFLLCSSFFFVLSSKKKSSSLFFSIGTLFFSKKKNPPMSRRSIHRRRFKCFVKHLKNRALPVSRNAASVAPQNRVALTRWVGGIDPHTGCADFTRIVKLVPIVKVVTPCAPLRSVEEILIKLRSSCKVSSSSS